MTAFGDGRCEYGLAEHRAALKKISFSAVMGDFVAVAPPGSPGWRARHRHTGGPRGDHTVCSPVHDLRVCACLARPQTDPTIAPTCGNVLPLLTGGQVVVQSGGV